MCHNNNVSSVSFMLYASFRIPFGSASQSIIKLVRPCNYYTILTIKNVYPTSPEMINEVALKYLYLTSTPKSKIFNLS